MHSVAIPLFVAIHSLAPNQPPVGHSLAKQGSDPAITIQIKDLTPQYKAFRFKLVGGQGGLGDMLTNPMMMIFGMMGAMGGQGDAPPFELFGAMDIYWTKGETFSAFGQPFLVSYKLDIGIADLAKSQGKPDLKSFPLRLQLVKPEALQVVSPLLDMTPEQYSSMLKMPPTPPVPPPSRDEDENPAQR